MAPSPSPKAAKARRARTSIAHTPYREQRQDKENVTVHGTAPDDVSRKSTKRGLRSHSLGPGGVEALGEASGNRQKIQPLPRSILKPSIPLSPPKPIPRLSGRLRFSPTTASQSPGSASKPHRGADRSGEEKTPGDTADLTGAGIKVSVRTEEDQQAAAREREREEIEKRREERRKSLANRRVSFAPEATLHTWDVVELAEDATSSSEATNSTRRASGTIISASPYSQHQPSHEVSSSPTKAHGEEVQVAASPASLPDSQRQKKRRSSGIPPMNFNDPQDLSSSPASSAGSDNTHQSFAAGEDDVVDESDTDEDRDLVEAEETITNVDGDDDATANSVTSGNTESINIDSSGELDKALREATQRAGIHRMGFDEAHTEAAAGPASEAASSAPEPMAANEAQHQDTHQQRSESEDEEMTMDVTQSIGGILPATGHAERSPTRRAQRKSLAARRDSVEQDTQSSVAQDETMEFTTAMGQIQSTFNPAKQLPKSLLDDDEEMTMDFTAVVGGVMAAAKSAVEKPASRPQTTQQEQQDHPNLLFDDDNMDITMARGTILSPVTERTEGSEEGSIGTNVTAAVSAILPGSLRAGDKTQAKLIMEEEADHGQLTRTSLTALGHGQDPTAGEHSLEAVIAPETVSPQPRQSNRRRSSVANLGSKQSASPARQTTPLRKVATPTKQLTPNLERPSTPSKTPPSKNVSMRKTSPKRLFKESKPSSSSPSKSPAARRADAEASIKNASLLEPQLILTPKTRRTSAPSIDQAGMGSPRVAAILDRRNSIGDQAAAFAVGRPGVRGVRFEDPRELTKQLDNERAEQARRESGRGILQTEADAHTPNEPEHTGSLREMIGGLTPKKTKLNGRKSLAVGGAKGLLGKRPRELDDDEDATPKRLKGKDQSPVKNILLPAPPSKVETTGRLGKVPPFKLSATADAVQTPVSQSPQRSVSSPDGTGRFKNTKVFKSAEKPPPSFNEQLHGEPANADFIGEDEPIHLQDFLNMTSIRFMELTTTKRRHTMALGKATELGGDDTLSGSGTLADPADDRGLAACVAAGASTIPLLELYQHSCRELKKYISEGRSIVREIENDTLEDNPPLFREYLAASPQVRAIMDNQFKNVKTHARLLSKEMWYEWRMKLLDGLKEGLARIQQGLDADESIMEMREQILQAVMPQLLKENAALEQEASTLRKQADELAECDPTDLQSARGELVAADSAIAATKKQIEELEAQVEEKTSSIKRFDDRKASCNVDIAEAERAREKFRGWSAAEVLAQKEKVDGIQAATGWTISSAHEESIVLLYRSEVALHLTPSSFKSSQPSNRPNTAISLSYASEAGTCTTTQRFFLQLLRARLLCVHQARTPIRDVLAIVENGWNMATAIGGRVTALQACWPTHETILSDESLQISSAVLLRNYRTKIEASFDIMVSGNGSNVTATVRPHAEAVYGAELKEEKMSDVLVCESGLRKDDRIIGAWTTAVESLEKKLNKFLAGKEKP